jgi:hypothetical protein
MHRMSNLNKFKDYYQVFEKHLGLCLMRKKGSKTHKECLNKFFWPKILTTNTYMLMCIKGLNVTKTKCLVAL